VITEAARSVEDGDDAKALFANAEILYNSLASFSAIDDDSGLVLETGLPLLRSISIQLHNEYGNTADAAVVMAWCIDIAEVGDSRDQFEAEYRQLHFLMHMALCANYVSAGRWAEAERYARSALSYASTIEERRTANEAVAAMSNKQNKGISPKLILWIFAGAIVIILFIWGSVAGSDDASSAIPSGSDYIPSQRDLVCPGMLNQLNIKEQDLDSLESEITMLESQYPQGVASASVVDRYNNLVDDYEIGLSRYNALVRNYNSECAR
jgi:hypothetical protein